MGEIQTLLKPYEIKLNGNLAYLVRDEHAKLELLLAKPKIEPETVCICAIGMFRQRPDEDYLAALVPDVDDGEAWTLQFGLGPVLPWMAGIALTQETASEMSSMNRAHGTFHQKHHWRPVTWIEDLPGDKEHETYIEWLMRDLNDVNGPDDIPDEAA